jgi:hypothetical protein
MYYGGADSCIALATANLADLLDYIKECPVPAAKKKLGIAVLD